MNETTRYFLKKMKNIGKIIKSISFLAVRSDEFLSDRANKVISSPIIDPLRGLEARGPGQGAPPFGLPLGRQPARVQEGVYVPVP